MSHYLLSRYNLSNLRICYTISYNLIIDVNLVTSFFRRKTLKFKILKPWDLENFMFYNPVKFQLKRIKSSLVVARFDLLLAWRASLRVNQETHFVWIFFVLWAKYFVREIIWLQLHSINLYWNNLAPKKTSNPCKYLLSSRLSMKIRHTPVTYFSVLRKSPTLWSEEALRSS